MNPSSPDFPGLAQPMSPFGLLVEADGGARIDELPPQLLLREARRHRLLVLRGFKPFDGPDELEAYGRRMGQVPVYAFGPILDVVEHESPADGVFGSNWLPYHWDGMFMDRVPEFQFFQAVSAPEQDQGGRTLFCDTTLAIAGVPPEVRALWEATEVVYTINKAAHYGGTIRTPLVVPHPDHGFPTLRYHEPVPQDLPYPNPITLHYEGIPEDRVAEVERTVREALYDSRYCVAHDWRTGDYVLADNYTMLHAREAYTSLSGRHLRRVHVLGDPPLDNPALPRRAEG